MLRRNLTPILTYGTSLGFGAILLQWGRYRLLIIDDATEWYVALIAVVFIGAGAWLGKKMTRPHTIIQREIEILEIEVPVFPVPEKAPAVVPQHETGISAREHEVLQLLARGLTNEEIGKALFVSANTVKTHLSNLYFKLEVKRRTQAVEKARLLGLLDNQ